MPEAKRLCIFQDSGEITIEIGPYQNRFWGISQLAGAIVFAVIAFQSTRTLAPLIHSGHPILGLCYIAIFAALSFLYGQRFVWFTFGREEIVLRGALLSVSRSLGVLKTSRVYRLQDVRDIHAALWTANAFSPVRGRIGFRYQGRMRYMADRIGRGEAKMLVKLFRGWLPRDAWTPVLGL